MPISTSNVSIDSIRQELGKGGTANFNLNTAEDGGYATINICSASKPSANNPSSLDEWKNYDHNAACTSTEFSATICDTNGESCTSTFNATEAQQNLTIVPYTGVSRNFDGINETWLIRNITRFPNASITVADRDGIIFYQTTGANFPAGGWDLLANYGAANGLSIQGVYYVTIAYNDGTGRTVSTSLTTINTYGEDVYFNNAVTQASVVTSAFTTSTVTSGFCLNTHAEKTSLIFQWPIVVGTTWAKLYNSQSSLPLNPTDPLSNKFFRRGVSNKYYRTNADGIIVQEYTC